MFAKVFIFLKTFILRKMNTEYFQGFVIKINTFYAAECHLNSTQNTNTRNFTFRINSEKFEKVFNSFINYIIDFLYLTKKVVPSA